MYAATGSEMDDTELVLSGGEGEVPSPDTLQSLKKDKYFAELPIVHLFNYFKKSQRRRVYKLILAPFPSYKSGLYA